MIYKVVLPVLMLVVCLATAGAAAPPPAFLDSVMFGDRASEAAHGLAESNTTAANEALGQTCRRISPEGSLAFEFKCDPERQNYLTVKFWGSDGDVATLFLTVNDKRLGAYGDMRPELDLGQGGPAFPGRFYYATYMIPREATTGKPTVRLKIVAVGSVNPYATDPAGRESPLRGKTRGIYRAYIGAEAFFRPDGSETQGQLPAPRVREKPAGFPDTAQLRRSTDEAVAELARWQVYGPEWQRAAVAQRTVPEAILGAIAQGANPSSNRTEREWKDFVASQTTNNCLPIGALAVFAKAHQGRWSRYYQSPEMLDRVVKGVDFYCRLQGSNGAFTNKTWVGGPQRQRAAGSCLEGFGTYGLGQAVLLLQKDLAAKLLDQPFDAIGDIALRPASRRAAWGDMLARHRDFLAGPGGRGHATNQDLAQINALWVSNEAVRILLPPRAWPREKAMEYVYSAVGLAKNPLGGYWVTEKGLALEPWGTLAGGYCGNYGLMGTHMICRMAEVTGDEKVRRRAQDAMRAASYFYYPDADADGYPTWRKEGIISTRNTKWPAVTDYGGDPFAAAVLKEPPAVRSIQLPLSQGVMAASPHPSGGHFIDGIQTWVFSIEHYEAALALPPAAVRLPMEPESPDFAWADEQGLAVAAKDQGARMYMSLNWRRGFKDNQRDPEHAWANNIARIHFTTPTVDRIATIAMESPDGFGGLYLCRYGDYFVAMNASAEKSCAVPLPPEMPKAPLKDLISGRTFPAGQLPQLGPRSTMVLRPAP